MTVWKKTKCASAHKIKHHYEIAKATQSSSYSYEPIVQWNERSCKILDKSNNMLEYGVFRKQM